MVIIQMHPQRNMFKFPYGAHGLHIFGVLTFVFFLWGGLITSGTFFLFTGKWAYNWRTYKLEGGGGGGNGL